LKTLPCGNPEWIEIRLGGIKKEIGTTEAKDETGNIRRAWRGKMGGSRGPKEKKKPAPIFSERRQL